MSADPADTIRVTVVWSPAARQVQESELVLPQGATVADAVRASGFELPSTAAGMAELALGVWNRKVSGGQVLAERDRVEIYRPLAVDPKLARRERFKKQGVKKAGLFAQKRAGAKTGY